MSHTAPTISMNGRDYDSMLKEIKAHISQEIKSIKNIVVERPLDYQGAADYLGINIRTLHRRIAQGKFPEALIHRNEGTTYFLPSELHEFIKKS